NTAAAAAAYTCSAINNRRRSTRSASAPAKSASIKVGDRLAVWTSATVVALACPSTRNHCAPTVCIHVPILEARAATNRPRNAPLLSGAHVDDAGPTSLDAMVFPREVVSLTEWYCWHACLGLSSGRSSFSPSGDDA